MVTAYINKEFASIKTEEEGKKEIDKSETTQKTTLKTTRKTKDAVLDLIRENPAITRDELAQAIGITSDGIKYHIKNLKDAGRIEREGGDKGGYWKIIE